MREFGEPIDRDRRAELVALMSDIYGLGQTKREMKASDFSMDEEPDRVVAKEVEVRWDDERLRVAQTEEDARPPFEWFYEISSDVGEADYFKHYLVREKDIVLAQRKVLTVIDEVEAKILEADLVAALKALKG